MSTKIVPGTTETVVVPDHPIFSTARPKFGTPDSVDAVAAKVQALPGWEGEEGARSRLILGPGMIQVSRHDPARAARTAERAADPFHLWRERWTKGDGTEYAHESVRTSRPVIWGQHTLGPVCAETCGHDSCWSAVAGLPRPFGPSCEGPCQHDSCQIVARYRTRGTVTAWSAKSRARMVKKLASLDYRPLFEPEGLTKNTYAPAMLTLTYPGGHLEDCDGKRFGMACRGCGWLRTAPTAAEPKAHLDTLKRRYLRDWGRRLIGVWKREFQVRGAPHYHILMLPPHGTAACTDVLTGQRRQMGFRDWIAHTWTAIAGPENFEGQLRMLEVHQRGAIDFAEGMRATDPRRLAVYFSKHGSFSSKEYQNEAPVEWTQAGGSVGRYWGVWGLKPATVTVEVSPDQGLAAARTLRRWSRANGYRKPGRLVIKSRWHAVDPATGEMKRLQRMSDCPAGWDLHEERYPAEIPGPKVYYVRRDLGYVVVNDAPAFMTEMVDYVNQFYAAPAQPKPAKPTKARP